MRCHNSLTPHSLYQAGFTLVELMVAMSLSLVLMGAVAQSFISSKESHQMREQVALLTENGRYATEALQRDIRMAGYSGCRKLDSLEPNIIANDPPNFSTSNDGLQGFESGAGWTNPTPNTYLAGTDVITINRASGQGVQLTGNMSAANANIQIGSNPYGIKAGDVLLITDCESVDLFRASNVSQAAATVTIAHDSNANKDVNLSNLYQENATIMKFSSNTYFVGASDNSGGTSLYMIPFESTVAIELAPNVQDLQFQYSIDTNNDQIADDYVDASAIVNWQQVIGVNIGILQYTTASITAEPQAFMFKGVNVNPSSDHRLRNSFWVTVGLRNRLN